MVIDLRLSATHDPYLGFRKLEDEKNGSLPVDTKVDTAEKPHTD